MQAGLSRRGGVGQWLARAGASLSEPDGGRGGCGRTAPGSGTRPARARASLRAARPAQIFSAYTRNVQRIVDAFARGQKEIKADLQSKLAGASRRPHALSLATLGGPA
jgi:hypothetical protein